MLSTVKEHRIPVSTQAQEEALRGVELIRRHRSGDPRAFEEIVSCYRPRLLGLATAMIHNATEAEDIVQEAFIRAHRGLTVFRGDSSLATWLHRITANLSKNRYHYLRRRRVDKTLSIDAPMGDGNDTQFSDILACNALGPNQVTVIAEFERLVERCMRRLTSIHREALGLILEEHMTYEQAGEALEIQIGTVKSRVARARHILLQHMRAECPELVRREDIFSMIRNQEEQFGIRRA